MTHRSAFRLSSALTMRRSALRHPSLRRQSSWWLALSLMLSAASTRGVLAETAIGPEISETRIEEDRLGVPGNPYTKRIYWELPGPVKHARLMYQEMYVGNDATTGTDAVPGYFGALTLNKSEWLMRFFEYMTVEESVEVDKGTALKTGTKIKRTETTTVPVELIVETTILSHNHVTQFTTVSTTTEPLPVLPGAAPPATGTETPELP